MTTAIYEGDHISHRRFFSAMVAQRKGLAYSASPIDVVGVESYSCTLCQQGAECQPTGWWYSNEEGANGWPREIGAPKGSKVVELRAKH